VLLVVAVAVGGGIALAFGLPGAGAKGYSAYADPQKPVLSYLLANHQNVEEFQKEFGLSDERLREILAVVRDSDSALSREYDESEEIVHSNEGTSETETESKIADSDFDEKVKRIVARTKSEVRDLLPDGRAADLGPWVDDQWQAETAEYGAASEPTYQGSSRRSSCKIYATYYRGYTRYEVALPHKKVKFSGRHRVKIIPVRGGTRTPAPVRDVGPWNVRDNYWRAGMDRNMWKNLPRCVPEAQAAFFRNYHRGKDQYGREVLNPAGIDITLAVASSMHVKNRIQRRGYIKVHVRYPWVRH
jgi:hypothetical protein